MYPAKDNKNQEAIISQQPSANREKRYKYEANEESTKS